MKKIFKFILSFLSVLVILFVSVPIIVSMLLQVSVIQNFVVDKVTEVLSAKAKSKMSISHIDIEFFNRVVIDDAYVEDHRGDTMIYIKKLKVGIEGINFLNGKISLGAVDVIQGECRLYKDSTGLMNVQSVFDNFKPKVVPVDQPNFRMSVREVNLIDFDFSLHDYYAPKRKFGINFMDMDFAQVNFQARKLEIFNYDIWLAIEHLRFKDKSGFYLQHLSSPRCGVNESGMRFEKLRMETPSSILRLNHLYMLYDTWYAYNDFVNEVTLDADISPSRLSYRTLSYFIGQEPKSSMVVQLQGRVRGAIPNLNGYLSNVKTGNTEFGINFSVVGLPDITNTRFNLLLNNLVTNARDIQALYTDFTGAKLGSVSEIIERAGEINVNGDFKGYLHDFMSQASIKTNQGQLNGKIGIKSSGTEKFRFDGNLASTSFNLGSILRDATFRDVSFDVSLDMKVEKNSEPLIEANGKVSKIFIAGYDFHDITLDGKFVGKKFTGSLNCDDPNLVFATNGELDLSTGVPSYDFGMDLRKANFVALGINKRDSISELSAKFRAIGLGRSLDDINGNAKIEQIVYVNHIDTVRAGDITIESINTDSLKQMKMSSRFADVHISGTDSYSQITNYMAQAAQKYIPSFPDAQAIIEQNEKKPKEAKKETKKFKNGSYSIDVNVKKANNVASIFIPGLEIAQGTRLSFLFDPGADKFRIDMKSDYIKHQTEQMSKIVLTGRNSQDSALLRLSAQVFEVGGLYMPNFEVRGRLMDNRIGMNVRFNNPNDGTSADLRTLTSIYRTQSDMPQIKFEFLPTKFAIEGETWLIDPSHLLLDSTGVEVKDFKFHSSEEAIAVNGKIGRNDVDTLRVRLSDLDMSPLSLLVSELGYKVAGRINGEATGVSLLRDMKFNALFYMRELKLNNYSLGNPCFAARWNQDSKRVEMGVGKDPKMNRETSPILGYFDIANSRYLADIRFPEFDMVLLEPLLKGILTNTSGKADVKLMLTGHEDKPSLNGTIDIEKYNLRVDYTKAEYSLTGGRVNVVNNRFEAKALPLTDNLVGSGTLNAWLDSKYFKNLTFGANIRMENLLALNTTVDDNEIFYGRAFGNGEFSITGNERNTSMVINAQTALESAFNLPFTDISTISDASFIKFVNPNQTAQTKEPTRSSLRRTISTVNRASDLDIKINLNVLQNTKASISMSNNVIVNDIKGVGNGNLRLHINPSQNIFTMNGSYEIVKGSYQFQFKTIIIDKLLSIQPGGTVSWSGDPADPTVNIEAVYRVKTSLTPIMGSAISQRGSNTTLNCGINLVGKLFTPTLNLSITAPSADPETQNFLQNYLNTQEIMYNQFFSLLMFSSFTPDMNTASIGSMGTALVGSAGFEFLSNQLSNLLSNEKYSIKVGFRPGTENTSDEFSLDYGRDIISNILRIEVGGVYNTGNNKTYSQRAPFTGEAYLTYILNKAGTLQLKGFTRVIDRFDETQGLQESGVGIYYRQDFQTIAELRAKMKTTREVSLKRRAEKKSKREAKKETAKKEGK